MKKKVSLIKDCYKEMWTKKAVRDERIIEEERKVINVGFIVLFAMLYGLAFLADSMDASLRACDVIIIFGIVSYIMLIISCKKGLITMAKDNFILTFLMAPFINLLNFKSADVDNITMRLWHGGKGFFYNAFCDICGYHNSNSIAGNKTLEILFIVIPIITAIILYVISEIVYIKSQRSEE